MRNNETYICITDLKRERGWTGKLIDRFLPEPDKVEPNPFYPSSYPMKLYKLSRVLEVEQCLTFKNELLAITEGREKRQKNDRSRIAEKILESSDEFFSKRGTDLQRVIFESNDLLMLVLAREVISLLRLEYPDAGQLRNLKSIVNSKIRSLR